MHARPEPGQRDLLGIGAELAGELWPPHKVVDAPPHHAANPGGRRASLQALMLPLQLQVGNGGAQPQAVERREWAEAQYPQGRVERPRAAVDQTGGSRARPHQPRAKSKLVYQRNGVAVGSEEVMVELLQIGVRQAGKWKAGSQASRCRLPLQHGHRLATLGQP